MKDDIKAEWQKKLRSGEFAQGNGRLRSWDEEKQRWVYCCLGILCEMSGLAEWVEYAENRRTKSTYLGSKYYLPVEVAEWAGIDPCYGDGKTIQQRLGTVNDRGDSFKTVADTLDTIQDL